MSKFLDSTGLSYLVSKIKATFVAKENGKGLSANDYTDAAKAKVDNIPANPLYSDTKPSTLAFAQDTTNNNVKGTITLNDNTTVVGNIPVASKTDYGVTKLSSATDSTSEALAATPKAVKQAYDLAASKTANIGTVTKVSVGNADYEPDGTGAVELPAYPTTLPASDVYAWAKAENKPTYTYSEVGAVPASAVGQSIAQLDQNGYVPHSQLDLTYSDVGALPATAAGVSIAQLDENGHVPHSQLDLTIHDLGGIPSSAAGVSIAQLDENGKVPSAQLPTITPASIGAVPTSEIGVTVAELDGSGKVPSSQLPSYVDDVIEGYYKAADGKFYEHYSGGTYSDEITGETGKIYVDLTSNKSYRYSGSAFVEISSSDVTGIKVGASGTTITPSGGVITIPAYEEGAQVHIAPTAAEVKTALGTSSGGTKFLREDGTWQNVPPADEALSNAEIDSAWNTGLAL